MQKVFASAPHFGVQYSQSHCGSSAGQPFNKVKLLHSTGKPCIQFSGAAQSSVTLYGVADAGVGRVNSGSTHDPRAQRQPLWGVNAENGNGKAQFISGSLMNNTQSRVGFRGVEDMGNGLKAGFQFETGLDLDNGAADGTFWQRQANVWVGGNWGTFKLGRQFTPSYLVQSAYELTGEANYSVLANTFGTAGLAKRADSAFAYVTPNMSGLTAAVAFVSRNDSGLAKNVWDLGVLYANGPIGAGLSVNKGLDNGKTNYQLGAKYTFSNFTVGASYNHVTGIKSLLGEPRRRGVSIGASGTFAGFTVTADITRDTKNDFHGKKWTNALLEAKYAMSKRTFVYGAALRLDGQMNYGIGLRHNF